jgi:ABC-2 type transport system ATP-binding protein
MGKAILISSHILTELSEMCHGVAIIERGTIRATGAVADVTRSVQAKLLCFVRTLSSLDEAERALRELPGVHTVRPDGTGLLFELDGGDAEMERILAELVARRLRPVEFAVRSQNLEDLFMALTEGKVQ